MNKNKFFLFPLLLFLLMCFYGLTDAQVSKNQTIVTIQGDKFFINGEITYKGRQWNGHSIEGLLMNSRMVQGIFDDLNLKTVDRWKYPDTHTWDADRNTNEFVNAMSEWHSKGLLAFTINLQGGSPLGYGNNGWINSAIDSKGELRPAYMNRLEKILTRADELRMVVILGIYYFGQDQFIENEAAIIKGVDNTIDWLFSKNYRNVLIEVNNECDIKAYDHDVLKPDRIHELIGRITSKKNNSFRFLVGTSFAGGSIPTGNVVQSSDFILVHANGVNDPAEITRMVKQIRAGKEYRSMPVLFNEDDHYDFDKPSNNFVEAVKAYASWGYFDYRMKGEGYDDGFQSVPVNWGISSPRKKGFFDKLEEITGELK